MIARVGILLSALLLGACGSTPPAPDWQLDTRSALDAYERHRLSGQASMAGRVLARALAAVSATGRPDLVARVQLVRCALDVATLAFAACPDPRSLAEDGGPEERAYAVYLSGAWEGLDAARLPPVHAAVVLARDDAARLAALGAIETSASRLVAAGVLFRRVALPPAGIDGAVDTASEAGHRAALLAWLGVQEQTALAAGETARATLIRRRIEVAASPIGPAVSP